MSTQERCELRCIKNFDILKRLFIKTGLKIRFSKSDRIQRNHVSKESVLDDFKQQGTF